MERLWLIFILIIAVVSCAKKDHIPPKYRATLRFQTPIDVEKTLAAWKVSCDDKTKCPSSVGQITVRMPSEIIYCTAFLVDSQTIMTNSHCLPETAQCSRDVTIHFPESGNFKSEKVQCEQVMEQFHLGDNPMVTDYVRIKIKGNSTRETLTRDTTTGVKDGEKLLMITMDPHPKDAIKGILKIQEVKVAYESFQTPASNKPNSSVHALVGKAVEGNSGSPIVTENMKTVKLMAQSVLDKRLSWFPDLLEYILKEGPSMIYAANMTCIISTNCDDISERTLLAMTENDENYRKKTPKDTERLNQILAERGTNKVFRADFAGERLKLSLKEGAVETVEFVAVPKCFNETSTWLEEYKDRQTYRESAKITWPTIIFKKKVSIDENGKGKVEHIEDLTTKGKSTEVTFSPAQMKANGKSPVTFMGKNSVLSVCGK